MQGLRKLWQCLFAKQTTQPAHLATGEWGEAIAEKFLKQKGYRILGRRVHFGNGEFDLIARDGEDLVFVEVKTRAPGGETRPAVAVDRRKRLLLAKNGMKYARRLKRSTQAFRFDIVEVVGRLNDRQPPEIQHLVRAFDHHGRWR